MNETEPPIIYNEADVPPYTLPELLTTVDGTRVLTAESWQGQRRSEILDLFHRQVYGATPATLPRLDFEEQLLTRDALNGQATCKQFGIRMGGESGSVANLLIYLPNNPKRPVPLFVGLNFDGNHTIHTDPTILISEGILASGKPTDPARGAKAERWAVEQIIQREYGVATIYCGDLAIDDENAWQQRAYAQMTDPSTGREPSTWGAIGVWAWGLSRAMDYFEKDDDIDHKRVAVMGHSRLGKTALWAGAQDERFRMVISNNSGCGGAAISRRCFGETVEAINSRFPHWFCENFRQYNGNEPALPVDQHMILALVAPRPLYVASAEEDLWADPKGEFLGIQAASPIYQLFGQEGLPINSITAGEMPPLNQPVVGSIGYHYRTGGHDVTRYDWERYMDFADKHFLYWTER